MLFFALLTLASFVAAKLTPYNARPYYHFLQTRQEYGTQSNNASATEIDLGYSIYRGILNTTSGLNIYKGLVKTYLARKLTEKSPAFGSQKLQSANCDGRLHELQS